MVSSQANAALKDRALLAQPFDCPAEVLPQRSQIGTAYVPQVYPLQIPPEPFCRIQLRRIARQLLQLQALRPSVSQELFDRFSTVDRRSIPDHQQLALNLRQQMFQEDHDVHATICPLLTLGEHLSTHRDAADRRDVLVAQRDTQNRRLANRSVGAHHAGQEREARLIYPDNGSPVGCRPFFSAGQRCAYQAAIFASSRWVARRIGFCGLQRSAFRRRLTCAG